MKLRWTDHARRDLLAIGRYIPRDDPPAARRWNEQLRERARLAAENPLAGRLVPDEDNANPPPRSYYHMSFSITVTLN